MYGIIHDAGMETPIVFPAATISTNPSQTAISQWSWWSSPALWGGIDTGDHRFRSWFLGVVDAWKNVCSGKIPYSPWERCHHVCVRFHEGGRAALPAPPDWAKAVGGGGRRPMELGIRNKCDEIMVA